MVQPIKNTLQVILKLRGNQDGARRCVCKKIFEQKKLRSGIDLNYWVEEVLQTQPRHRKARESVLKSGDNTVVTINYSESLHVWT